MRSDFSGSGKWFDGSDEGEKRLVFGGNPILKIKIKVLTNIMNHIIDICFQLSKIHPCF